MTTLTQPDQLSETPKVTLASALTAFLAERLRKSALYQASSVTQQEEQTEAEDEVLTHG